jgi:hypothetical protein
LFIGKPSLLAPNVKVYSRPGMKSSHASIVGHLRDFLARDIVALVTAAAESLRLDTFEKICPIRMLNLAHTNLPILFISLTKHPRPLSRERPDGYEDVQPSWGFETLRGQISDEIQKLATTLLIARTRMN